MPRTTCNSQQAGYINIYEPITAPMATTHKPTPDPAHVETVNEDTTKESPLSTKAQEFAKIIGKLFQGSAKPAKSKPKLREPDTFDGSDPQKLHTFILQCKLNFHDWKDLFEDKAAKVNYALSYLKGIALDCFEPTLLGSNPPEWLSKFDLFVAELKSNFGKPPGYEIFYQVPAASRTSLVGRSRTLPTGLQWFGQM